MTELRVKRTGATTLDPVSDSNPLPVEEMKGEGEDYGDYQPITVSTTAIGLTPSTADGIVYTTALITVETAAIRFHLTSNDVPTATTGHKLNVDDSITLDSAHQITNFRAIRRDAADATLVVSYGS